MSVARGGLSGSVLKRVLVSALAQLEGSEQLPGLINDELLSIGEVPAAHVLMGDDGRIKGRVGSDRGVIVDRVPLFSAGTRYGIKVGVAVGRLAPRVHDGELQLRLAQRGSNRRRSRPGRAAADQGDDHQREPEPHVNKYTCLGSGR